jgi:carbonic anhydrase/acetyltransferase-like protein (isoleucine patch superfamily)
MPLYAYETHVPKVADPARLWLAPGAHVMGKVTLGIDVGIWFGAVLRGDNEPIEIGDETNIQENVVMHVDPGFGLKVGKGCTIGHASIVHGCTIGDNTLIGMGATVLNGARIGNNCLVGAGALVTEGKEFAHNQLIVGTPAKAIRTLDEESILMLRRAAENYMDKARRYLRGLVEVDATGRQIAPHR